MTVRGIRGATTVEADQPELLLAATRELLEAILDANPGLHPDGISSAFFSMTGDLHSAFPAQAARQMGWEHVPMMCLQEIPVPDSLPRCIRVLIHWNTETTQESVQHVYLHAATLLRPDLVTGMES